MDDGGSLRRERDGRSSVTVEQNRATEQDRVLLDIGAGSQVIYLAIWWQGPPWQMGRKAICPLGKGPGRGP